MRGKEPLRGKKSVCGQEVLKERQAPVFRHLRDNGGRKRSRFLSLFLLLGLGLAACGKAPESVVRAAEAKPVDQVESFLESYWKRPLSAQGTSPARFSPLEASLEPASCGTCHVDQFKDWSQSLHSHAMGPGILGQLVNMPPHATGEHQDCIRCHAPLKEQADSLVSALTGAGKSSGAKASSAARPLHEQGLVCAACHLRGYQRYGPLRKDGSAPATGGQLPHNGWVVSPAFEDSRFCAACHQFKADEYALNGKLLENTYNEWKASRFGREGKTCQSCHMPDRRHLWRGIHDPEMVKKAVTISAAPVSVQSGMVSAALSIRNTGTGHYFPTYVTPHVVAEVYQENARGEMLPGTLKQYLIARQVPLDLSEEIADTRLAPDQEKVIDYRLPVNSGAATLVLRVRVEPDAFYTGFYRSLLDGKQAGRGEKLIRRALEHSTASAFTIFTSRQPLPGK